MTAASPRDPAPPRRRHEDLLAAAASGFVGALALAVSTYNVYLQRAQLRAQVWPRLTIESEWTGDNLAQVSLSVRNRGVGPAQIERVRVLVDGEPAGDWIEAESRLLRKGHFLMPSISNIEGQVVSPGLDIAAFKVEDREDARRFVAERRRLAIAVCYCSTLHECWELEARPWAGETTTPRASCPPDPKPFVSVGADALDQLVEHLADAGDARDAGDAGR